MSGSWSEYSYLQNTSLLCVQKKLFWSKKPTSINSDRRKYCTVLLPTASYTSTSTSHLLPTSTGRLYYFLRSELIEVGFLDQNNHCLLLFRHIILRYFEDNNIRSDQESLIILSSSSQQPWWWYHDLLCEKRFFYGKNCFFGRYHFLGGGIGGSYDCLDPVAAPPHHLVRAPDFVLWYY